MVWKFWARAHFRAYWAPEYSGHCTKNTRKIDFLRIFSNFAILTVRVQQRARANFFSGLILLSLKILLWCWMNAKGWKMVFLACAEVWPFSENRPKTEKNRKFSKKSIFLTKKIFWFYFDFGWIPIILRYPNVSWTFWHRYEMWDMTTILANFSGIILSLFAKKK